MNQRLVWAVHEVNMGQIRTACRISVGKHKGEETRGTPSHRWKDNIKMNHKERWCEGADWFHLAHDRVQWQALVNMAINEE